MKGALTRYQGQNQKENTITKDHQTASLLITNAQLVNEGSITEGSVFIDNGRIEQVGQVDHQAANQVIDANDQYVLPE